MNILDACHEYNTVINARKNLTKQKENKTKKENPYQKVFRKKFPPWKEKAKAKKDTRGAC